LELAAIGPNKKERNVNMLTSTLAFGLMAAAAGAQELRWTELAKRPELWPEHCSVKAAIKFEGGVSPPLPRRCKSWKHCCGSRPRRTDVRID
jgi:hypothetical protein